MAIDKSKIAAIYPSVGKLPDETITYWINYTSARIDASIPEADKEHAQGLLTAHYLYTVADAEGLANVESVKVKDKIEKKFYKRGMIKSNLDNNLDTTPFGKAYKDLVMQHSQSVAGKENKSFFYLD